MPQQLQSSTKLEIKRNHGKSFEGFEGRQNNVKENFEIGNNSSISSERSIPGEIEEMVEGQSNSNTHNLPVIIEHMS